MIARYRQEKEPSRSDVTLNYAYICIPFLHSKMSSIFYLFQQKKNPQKKNDKRVHIAANLLWLRCYISPPGEFALARFRTRDLCRFCTGLPSYPLRHPRSCPLKVIPFSKLYALKIISHISGKRINGTATKTDFLPNPSANRS